jgi:glycosyltransferase involved in cell wall biosynthesis
MEIIGDCSTMKRKSKKHNQDRLREIAWEVGNRYPIPLTADYIALSMINPHLGHVHWNIRKKSLNDMQKGKNMSGAPMIVRVYDVTDILFDGSNAHRFFDFEASVNQGNRNFSINRPARNYLAELGIRTGDGFFHPLVRSNATYFDGDRPSGSYQTGGLFAGGFINRTFTIENIFDAPVYEKMNRELAGIDRKEELSIAVVILALNQDAAPDNPLGSFVKKVSHQLEKFGGKSALFIQNEKDVIDRENKNVIRKIQTVSKKMSEKLIETHNKSPFHLIHCHDWYSTKIGLDAAKLLKLPLVISLHSTEYERSKDNEMDALASRICSWEKNAVKEADLVIVPHSSTRKQVINLYGVHPEKIVIIPDIFHDVGSDVSRESAGAGQLFGFSPDVPVVLFAGEMSHAAGADLLMEAIPTVCRNHRTAHFVFVGDGPLKGEMEARAWHEGMGQRCRFFGHTSGKVFESILMASDFVVIPARTWQDEGLAQMAIDHGRPVLTTHQSGIHCVVHGKTGLVTFDNPGSIIWGIQELLSNPMKESMHRIAITKSARETPSIENIAVQHYLYYEILLKECGGLNDA